MFKDLKSHFAAWTIPEPRRFRRKLARRVARDFIFLAIGLTALQVVFFRLFLASDSSSVLRPLFQNVLNYAVSLEKEALLLPPSERESYLSKIASDRKLFLTLKLSDGSEQAASSAAAAAAEDAKTSQFQRFQFSEFQKNERFTERAGVVSADKTLSIGRVQSYPAAILKSTDRTATLFVFTGFSFGPERAWAAAFAVLLALFGLGVLYFRLRRSLSPIYDLQRVVEQVALGDLGARSQIRSRDELGQLGTALNSMLTQISQLLSSKEELLIGVSHELKTPLTRARLILELSADPLLKSDLLRELQEMGHIVDELLEYGRSHANSVLKFETLTVQDLVELWKHVGSGEIEPQLATRLRSTLPQPLAFKGNPHSLLRIFRNIFENANRYGRNPDGKLTFEVTIELKKANRGHSFLAIRMSDSGEGIPVEYRGKIFEPFWRSEISRSKEQGGLGLGLSLCKRIAEAHGGNLEIVSNSPAQSGAHFELSIPLSEGLVSNSF